MPAAEPPADRPLGLTLRARTGMGAEVIRVAPGSAADRARLTVGDVITLIGAVPSPTPTQVAATFRSVPEGQRVMIGVTRGDTHQVTALER
jgi:S1-C subfamily serine protease